MMIGCRRVDPAGDVHVLGTASTFRQHIAGVVSYNRFVSQRNLIRDAWANIDTELRRRYDLIPNIVETVKGYAAHEREVFEEVARTRSAAAGATGTPAQQAAAEGPFMAALGRLF